MKRLRELKDARETGQGGVCTYEDALRILEEAVARIRRNRGRFGEKEDWSIGKVLRQPDPAPLVYSPSSRQTIEEIGRLLGVRDMLTITQGALGHLMEDLCSQADDVDKHIEALRLRKGMASLPDEVLEIVLEEAAYVRADYDLRVDDSLAATKTVWVAAKLSLTCRRFRQIIVRIPCLWNRIYSTMPRGMVSMCWNRLATARAEVHLTPQGSLSHPISEFIKISRNRSAHWSRFNQYHSWSHNSDGLQSLELTRNLELPSLSELSIRYCTYVTEFVDSEELYEAVHCYSSWWMPKLSVLTISNFVPIPLKTSNSLQNLSISVEAKDYHPENISLQAFTTFLASCEVVKELSLKLSCVRFSSLPKRRFNLSSVTTLEISCNFCDGAIIKPLMEAVRFPAVDTMRISRYVDHTKENPLDRSFDNTFGFILQDERAFPNLINLELHISTVWYMEKPDYGVILPFASMTTIKHLVLSTRDTHLAPLPEGHILPLVESLELRSCHVLEPEWIKSFLRRLIHSGKLNPSKLIAKECAWKSLAGNYALGLNPISALEIACMKYGSGGEFSGGVSADEMLKLAS